MNIEQYTMKRIRNTILKYLIMLYPAWISITRFVPFLGTLLTAIMLLVFILYRCETKQFWLKYTIMAVLLMISTSMYSVTTHHEAHIKVLLVFFLGMDCYYGGTYARVVELIKRYQGILLFQLVGILVLNLIFFFISAGYSVDYTEDWGFHAYQGIYGDPHQAAYHMCALLVILLWVSKIRFSKTHYILFVGFEFCILMTGARVPAGLAIMIGAIYCIDHRIGAKATKFAERLISYIPLILLGIIAIFLIMSYTSFGDKVVNGLQSTQFDNGRGNLRTEDMEFFENSNFICKLFGNGTDKVIQSHSKAIWSHNDFMQILCGMGVFVFLMYCWEWCKNLLSFVRGKKVFGTITVVVCMAVAFYNGLYIHSRFVFVMPMLFLYMHLRKSDELHYEKRKNYG